MNVIRLRRSRILKVSVAFLVFLAVAVLLFGSKSPRGPHHRLPLVPRDRVRKSHGRLVSHPGVKPVFLGTGKHGNFEPPSSFKVSSRKAPGENGHAHKLRFDQKSEEEKLKGVYGFNQLVSDEIGLNRTVPDLREPECKFWDYPTDLPKASVVLVFHNEGWSSLFRTVHSVINRTPPQFLEEVVLVDDESELPHLHKPLEEELEKPYYKGRVRIVRNKQREGLIRSRNNGAIASKGEVNNKKNGLLIISRMRMLYLTSQLYLWFIKRFCPCHWNLFDAIYFHFNVKHQFFILLPRLVFRKFERQSKFKFIFLLLLLF